MDNTGMKAERERLVSVVLCFHNEESFLTEAIESVLLQDYDHWELWLVDDGSTDDSTQIAKRYATQFPGKVHYLDHPYHQNNGVSASRNKGIRHCRGAYVAFLDADDVWLPCKLREQLEIFRRHPEVSVVLQASLYWNSWADGRCEDVETPVGLGEGVYRPPSLMVSLYPLGTGAAPCPSGIMVQRTILRRCPFEELFRGVLQMYEDQAFLSKIYLKETVYVSAACHNKYRIRASSLVSAAHESGNYDKVRSYFLYWLRDYLRRQPHRYKSVERLLRRAQMPYREPFLYMLRVKIPALLRKAFVGMLIRLGILNYSKSW